MSDTNKLPEADKPNNNSNENSIELNENQNVETTAAPVVEANDDSIEDHETPKADKNADIVKAENEKEVPSENVEEHDEVINEIEESNAEDAEDEGNKDRHKIEVKEYDTMSLESLAIELEKLLKNEKVQAIKSHVDNINAEFKTKFQALLDEKKEDFLNDGGNEIDFYYSSPVQKRFKEAYKSYRKKVNDHYQSLEKNLKQNFWTLYENTYCR